jgi:hypothetical protein
MQPITCNGSLHTLPMLYSILSLAQISAIASYSKVPMLPFGSTDVHMKFVDLPIKAMLEVTSKTPTQFIACTT